MLRPWDRAVTITSINYSFESKGKTWLIQLIGRMNNEGALPDYLGQARRMLNKRLQSVPNGSVFVCLRNL